MQLFLMFLAGGLILLFFVLVRWKYKKEKEADKLLPRPQKIIRQKIIHLDKCEEGEKLRRAAKKEKKYGRSSFLWGEHIQSCVVCRHKHGRNNK